jgi:hypothetical protein
LCAPDSYSDGDDDVEIVSEEDEEEETRSAAKDASGNYPLAGCVQQFPFVERKNLFQPLFLVS